MTTPISNSPKWSSTTKLVIGLTLVATFYLGGLAYLLVGVLVGTGLWIGWW